MSLKLMSCIYVFLTLFKLNHGFFLRDMHSSYQHNYENEDLIVNLELNDDDYEMDDDSEIDEPNTTIGENRFVELNSKEYEKVIKSHCTGTEWVKGNKSKLESIGTETDNRATTEAVSTLTSVHLIGKNEEAKAGTEKENDKSDSVSDKAYYAAKPGKFGSGSSILDAIKEIFLIDMVTDCTPEDARGIGIRSIKCLLSDYKENREPFEVLAFRLWNIAAVWIIVYLVVAIPLWCTNGWCCCCLCCKFFKPQETIKEAKKYLLMNPPGILVTKRGGIIHYEPTEREKHCYEEFGHFIRTL